MLKGTFFTVEFRSSLTPLILVGPDGALYILSWGHGYGGTLEKGKQIMPDGSSNTAHNTASPELILGLWQNRLPRGAAKIYYEPWGQASLLGGSTHNVNLTRGEESIAFLEDALAGELTTPNKPGRLGR